MIFEDKRYLPFSGRRISISAVGEVLDSSGSVLKTVVVDGHHFVNIDWIYGRGTYNVAVLVLVAFDELRIPEYLLDKVEPLYIDGNFNNLAVVNLLYKYKGGPLEVEGYPGFFYIPLYNGYGISKDGAIVNIATGKFKSWGQTRTGGAKNQTGGYWYTRVATDSGFSKILYLHRALCLVFLDFGHDIMSRVVNHKDGNPSNNKIENLEWNTYKENNAHAYAIGLRPNAAVPVLMKDLKSGLVKRFESFSECARNVGANSPDFVRNRLVAFGGKIYSDMLLFKLDDGSDWPELDMANLKICKLGTSNDIVARNIFTGAMIVFAGINNGEQHTGVKAATILRHVREDVPIPVNGYNFKYLSDQLEWPVHSGRHLEIYAKYPIYPPDGVVMTNSSTGEETFFCSAAELCLKLKISKQLLAHLVKKQSIFKNGCSFSYFKIRDSYGPSAE